MKSLYVLLSLAAGLGSAVQPLANNRLRTVVGDPLWASAIQTCVGLSSLVLVALVVRAPFPTLAGAARLPWWAWTGGMLGISYVVVTILAAPRVGTALMFASIVVGQLLGSVVLDHFGWLGAPVVPLSFTRLAGVALLIAGVLLVRW